MELTKEDVDEMKFSRGAKKVLCRVISGNSQPVPMDTTPPGNAMYPVPQRPARVEAQGGVCACVSVCVRVCVCTYRVYVCHFLWPFSSDFVII